MSIMGMPQQPRTYWNTDVLQRMIDDIRKRKQQNPGYKDYMDQRNFQDFAPKQLDTDFETNDLYRQAQQQALSNDRAATAIWEVKNQNKAAYQSYQNALNAPKWGSYQYMPGYKGTGGVAPPKGGYPGLKGVGVGANLGNYKWRGFNLTLNRSAAPRFLGFLSALYARGYRPASIGSYANRNIAGTNTKSLHAYGLAIDIDPRRNPVTWNGQNITALPPRVGALAAKYGLLWGGSWKGSKRDTMHFSVPYGGRY